MRFATSLAIVAAVAALATPSRAADTATAKQLKAEYVKYMKAVKAKDTKALDAMMAPEFKMTMFGKTYNRQQSSAMMQQEFQSIKSFDKWNYRFGPMKQRGNKVTTIVYEDTASTIQGPDGKTHKMTDKGTVQTEFRKIGGEWKVTNVKSLKDVETLDGKPFDPAAAMARDSKMMNGMKKKPGMKKGKM